MCKLSNCISCCYFAFADKEAVLSAAAKFHELKLGTACLIGDTKKIKKTADILNISLENMVIIDPETYKDTDKIIHKHYEKYWRSGLTQQQAAQEISLGLACFARFIASIISSLSRDLPKQPLDITAIFGSISTTLQISAVCKITSDKYSSSCSV